MDLTSIAVALVSAQAQNTATTTAALALKNSFSNDKQIAQLLSSSVASATTGATLASHLGTNLDISA